MSTFMILGYLLAGLALLVLGGEFLVRGSAALAVRIGLSPLLIGLTVVAFGTSAPELVVSLKAALSGKGGIAAGNVVGSNICNIALVLGVAGLIRPIAVHAQVLNRETPILIAITAGLVLFLSDFQLSRLEGFILALGIVLYIFIAYRFDNPAEVPAELDEAVDVKQVQKEKGFRFIFKDLVFVVLGLVGLVFGSDFFVEGAVASAKLMGVSEAVIGLTVVALGTSLPELATAIVAAFKGQVDILVGNVLGSNVFNILAILGITASIHPFSAVGLSWFDLGVMMALTAALFPLLAWGRVLDRWKAASFLGAYALYIAYLAQQSLT